MPTCKLPFQTLSDVLGLSDVEFNIVGATVLSDGSIELQVEDLSHTLQSQDALVKLDFSQRAVIRTLSTSHAPIPESQPLEPIMLWYRLNDRKEWEYNHYSAGHRLDAKGPDAVIPEHSKMWKNGKWGYKLAYLNPGKIPQVVNVGDFVVCQ